MTTDTLMPARDRVAVLGTHLQFAPATTDAIVIRYHTPDPIIRTAEVRRTLDAVRYAVVLRQPPLARSSSSAAYSAVGIHSLPDAVRRAREVATFYGG